MEFGDTAECNSALISLRGGGASAHCPGLSSVGLMALSIEQGETGQPSPTPPLRCHRKGGEIIILVRNPGRRTPDRVLARGYSCVGPTALRIAPGETGAKKMCAQDSSFKRMRRRQPFPTPPLRYHRKGGEIIILGRNAGRRTLGGVLARGYSCVGPAALRIEPGETGQRVSNLFGS